MGILAGEPCPVCGEKPCGCDLYTPYPPDPPGDIRSPDRLLKALSSGRPAGPSISGDMAFHLKPRKPRIPLGKDGKPQVVIVVRWEGRRQVLSHLQDAEGVVTPFGLSLGWPGMTPEEIEEIEERNAPK